MTHGKGREFKKLPRLNTDLIKEGHLQLFLFEAERAWAYSKDLVAQSLLPANAAHSATLRHSATGRFRRAVHWATQLLSQCQSLYNSSLLAPSALLQVTVYTLMLNGHFLRYRDNFDDALIQMCVARNLLDELAERAETSRDQALAVLTADDIGPEIRYCAHEMGWERAYDVDAIVKEFATKHRNELVEGCDALIKAFEEERSESGKGEGRKQLATLMWEEQPVPVRNPELVDAFLKVQEAETKLTASRNTAGGKETDKTKKKGKAHGSKRGIAAYDSILLALSEAENVARRLVEAQQHSSGASTSVAGTRDIQFVHAYIVYQLLSFRIQRDLLLVSTLLSSHPSRVYASSQAKTKQVDARLYPAIVKLLETVLQSLTQMRNLSIVDESPDLASAVEARITFTKARRCSYLAHCYVTVKKYAEALTLLQRATVHVRETRSTLSTFSNNTTAVDTTYPLEPAAVDTLECTISEASLTSKNEWFTYNGGSLDGDAKTYKKPLFFDIALNYVQLDMDRLMERAGKAPVLDRERDVPGTAQPARSRLEEEVRTETPEPPVQAKGGLSSLLGGWWGRK